MKKKKKHILKKKKEGRLCSSDTATLIFDNVIVKVPASNIIKEKNKGFLSNEKSQHKSAATEHKYTFQNCCRKSLFEWSKQRQRKAFGARVDWPSDTS
jgi:hypothetical protein